MESEYKKKKLPPEQNHEFIALNTFKGPILLLGDVTLFSLSIHKSQRKQRVRVDKVSSRDTGA